MRELLDQAEAVLGGVADRGVGLEDRLQVRLQPPPDDRAVADVFAMVLGEPLRVGQRPHGLLALRAQIPETRRDFAEGGFSHGACTVAG